jgi:hypothetical protein
MIALIIVAFLLIVTYITQKYTDDIMSEKQVKMLVFSSVWFIVIYIFCYNILIHQNTSINLLMENSLYIPLIFYILWYISCSIIIHKLQIHSGYGSLISKKTKNNMSEKDKNVLY